MAKPRYPVYERRHVSDDVIAAAVKLARKSRIDLPTDVGEVDHLTDLFRQWATLISIVGEGDTFDRVWSQTFPFSSLIGACWRAFKNRNKALADAILDGPRELIYANPLPGYEADITELARWCWRSTWDGDFSLADADMAGAILRDVVERYTPIIVQAEYKRMGGKAGASTRRLRNSDRDRRIVAQAKRLIARGLDKRNVATTIASTSTAEGLSARSIRDILKKAEVY